MLETGSKQLQTRVYGSNRDSSPDRADEARVLFSIVKNEHGIGFLENGI